MKKIIKRIVSILLAAVVLVVLVAGGYVVYLFADYGRIDDNLFVEPQNNNGDELAQGKEYSIMTYNIGFGAYSRDFSFFMDVGDSIDGEHRVGKYGKAKSKDDVLTNVGGAIETIEKNEVDFVFMQEVDVDSDRSYHVNQLELAQKCFSRYANLFAYNYHSSYLFYPFNDPHGKSNSGIATFSKFKIESALRKSFPISTSISKFFDLDRCFLVSRLKAGDKQLVLINVHMSAYDKGGKIRALQLKMLNDFVATEYEKGNYVIIGGDYNHDICESVGTFDTDEVKPDWVASIRQNDLPDGFRVVTAENKGEVATCRSCDIPYQKGKNYQAIVDGFIVSANITARATNIDTDYAYSDHNPVKMLFKLGSADSDM